MMAPCGSVPEANRLPVGRVWLWFAGIVAVHAALLAGAVAGLGRVEPPATPPTVIGMLVAARPPAEATLPKPLPAVPAPNAPPSERAVTAPPVPSNQPDQPQPAPAAPVTVAAASTPIPGPIPVIPPHTDASHLTPQ